jgi:hypothetical protein
VNKIGEMTNWYALGFVGCNVASPPPGTGGVVQEAGVDAMQSADASVCPSAVDIICSDYVTTNVEIAGLDGTLLSGSFVSSGSKPPGLSLALSGDVDIPFVPPASGRVLLIDRYGTNVLTWMDLAKDSVLAQLAVGTGFQSNPHDYVEVDTTRAFVTRYGTNPTPGQQANDQGGDLLIIDTKTFSITGRIAMPEEDPDLQPCPDGMNWIGGDVVVNLQRFSADFAKIGDGRFVGVSPTSNEVAWTVNITGLQNCGRVMLSPSGKTAAIACSSLENTTTNMFIPADSDIVLYDATQMPPVETKRLGLGNKLNAGLQPQIAFASEDSIVALTYGGNATPGDTVFAVNIATDVVTQLGSDMMPYVLGGIRCSPGCGDVCILSDAEKNVLRRWQVTNDAFTSMSDATVDPTIGLPPRDIGGLL